ncbi:DUF2164 domain-containing protein [Brevundimonas variabilis]|uniref:Uncharacterized protein (DUF2164 family) n=1 Tax=Brevundimonas variabilis TaxID=74312 RepID=A0A7W9CGY4_9CAUL|nr:DUF2164 domain-containing protein [Brevundimonas variabilis]MBB5745440.1 uncharacterized protein (DUF2164 family) [Brevundimonas variabilis]
MSKIEFSKEERAVLVAHIQGWFLDELDHEIGVLPAEALIDFIGKDIGSMFYNRGLYDAQALVAKKAEDMADALYGLEKKSGLVR